MEDTSMRFGHLMESALYITECEGKLFDTLINLDFQQAVREAEEPETDEAKEKNSKINDLKAKFTSENIKAKLNEIVAKAKAMIKKAAETVINKILGFIKADSKIVKRYKEAIANVNLDKFPGIKGFGMPKGYPSVDKLQQLHDSVIITDNSGKEEEVLKDAEEYMKEFIPEVEEDWIWKPKTTNELNVAIDALSESSTIIKTLRSCKLHDKLAIPANKIDKILFSKHGDADDRVKDAHAETIDIITAGCKLGVKLANIYLNGCIEIFKRYRKAVLTVGAFAIKENADYKRNVSLNDKDARNYNASTEEVGESVEALVYIVGETSDMTIDEAFAY